MCKESRSAGLHKVFFQINQETDSKKEEKLTVGRFRVDSVDDARMLPRLIGRTRR